MNTTLEQAHAYANEGYAVFPLHTIHGGKCTCNRCCRSPGKHPKVRGGFKVASTESNQIRGWFNQDANIGIATGKPSGLVVIDVDKKNGGYDSLAKLEREYGVLSDHTLVANTGGGGQHLFFKHNGDKLRSRVNSLGSGIDTRADGGYVVASPSMHASGLIYSWRDGFYPPAVLPHELLQELLKNPAKNGYSSAEIIPKGQRNHTLFNLASRFRAKGYDRSKIEFELSQTNSARCRPVLNHSEVADIAASASRYKKGHDLLNFKDHWLNTVYSGTSGLKSNVKVALTGIYLYMDKDGGNCYPSQGLLADRAGCTRQAIASNLRIAEQQGWIRSFKIATESNKMVHYGYFAMIPT